ncbi:MAG: hypothetical protein JO115_00130 [Pseudonocardiales bacterium]|nr:hypothetical protein [Pseudonocardiales bacterium]
MDTVPSHPHHSGGKYPYHKKTAPTPRHLRCLASRRSPTLSLPQEPTLEEGWCGHGEPPIVTIVEDFLTNLVRAGKSAHTVRAYHGDLDDFGRFVPLSIYRITISGTANRKIV